MSFYEFQNVIFFSLVYLIWFFSILIHMFVCLIERERERENLSYDIYLDSDLNVQRCIENKLIWLLIIYIQPLCITIYVEITFVLRKQDVELIFSFSIYNYKVKLSKILLSINVNVHVLYCWNSRHYILCYNHEVLIDYDVINKYSFYLSNSVS